MRVGVLGADASVGVEWLGDGVRDLLRDEVEGLWIVGARGKGEAAVIKHALGAMVRVGKGLDVKAMEHGI